MISVEQRGDVTETIVPESRLPRQTSRRRLSGLAGKSVSLLLALSAMGCNAGQNAETSPTSKAETSVPPTPIVTEMPTKTPEASASPSLEITLPPSSPDATKASTPTPTQSSTAEATASPTANPTPTETLSPRDKLLTPSLKEVAAKDGIKMGIEFTGWQFNDSLWRSTVESQFNLATIDWGLYWNQQEPTQGNFNFSTMDSEVAFAKANNLEIRGHGLIFPSALPDWLTNGHFTKAQLTTILEDHVKSIVERYKGIVKEWVVVNEPYINPYRTNDIFYKTIGPNYIDLAFKAAREADPSAKLIYADTDNESSGGVNGLTTQLTRETVARLKSEGLIDMVGMEMHIDASNPPSEQDVMNVMKSYGLPVAVTEFDVDLQNISGTQAQRYALQAQIASNMMNACKESNVCKEFTFWGIGDNYSWLEQGGELKSDPTPFDNNLNPKPEYFAIRKALS